MHCPLRLRSQKRPLGEATFGVPDFIEDFDICMKDGCAWWDAEKECCVIMHIGALKEALSALTAEKSKQN